MDRKQLRTLVAVTEHKSFSAAARALGTVQSNVSAHVARLEKELGVTLIDRATNEPTEEGGVVLERARRIEAEFEALDSDVASLHDVVSGSVRIGLIGTTARWLAPPLLTELERQYPEVSVVILDATTSSLILALLNGTTDLGVVNLPLDEPELVSEPLFDEDRILIVPEGHPLFDHEIVGLDELTQHELLIEAPGTAFRDVLDDAVARTGKKLQTRAEFDGMRLLASMAFAGFGVGLVPASAAPQTLEGAWRRIPVEGVPGRSVGLVRRRRGLPSVAQRAVAQLVRDVVRREAPNVAGLYPTADR